MHLMEEYDVSHDTFSFSWKPYFLSEWEKLFSKNFSFPVVSRYFNYTQWDMYM